MRYAGEEKLNIWVAMALGVLTLFPLFVVYPLVLVLCKNVLSEGGGLSFACFTKFFARKYYWNTLVNSFKVTIVSTLVAAVLGPAVAYVLRSVQTKESRYLNILIVISCLSPPFIGAYVWIQLLGQNGLFIKILNGLFHIKLGGIYGLTDIVLVFSLQSFPLVYMYIFGALKNLDNSPNEAAENLGCTTFQRMAWITVPLVMPIILANSLLVFMRMFSSSGTPVLIEKGYRTSPVLIYSQLMGEVSTDDHFAATFCVTVIGIILVLFFLQRYLGSRFTYSMAALKPMAMKKCIGTRNILFHPFMYAVVLTTTLPQITVIVTPFLVIDGGTAYAGGFFLRNYRNTPSSKNNNTAVFNTYLFGICTIIVVVVFGILISYPTVRKRSFLTGILDTVIVFPYIIPGSILGASFLYALDSKPLLLSSTAIIIIISLSIQRIPYTIRSSIAAIGQISPSMEKAAIGPECTGIKSSVKVTIPTMMSDMPFGTVMSRITLISELSSSVILYTNRTQTLTVIIYAEVIRSNFGNAAAYSIILTLTSILFLPVSSRVAGSNDISVQSLSMI